MGDADNESIAISGNIIRTAALVVGIFSVTISLVFAFTQKADKSELSAIKRAISDHRVELSTIKAKYDVKIEILREVKSELRDVRNELKTIRREIKASK